MPPEAVDQKSGAGLQNTKEIASTRPGERADRELGVVSEGREHKDTEGCTLSIRLSGRPQHRKPKNLIPGHCAIGHCSAEWAW